MAHRPEFLIDGSPSEYTIQTYVVQYISYLGYRDFLICIYNEGAGLSPKTKPNKNRYLRKTKNVRAHNMGLRPGASDLFLAVGRHGKFGFWLELKSKGGKVAPHQRKFLADMEKQNYHTAVAWSFDEAKELIDDYLDTNV